MRKTKFNVWMILLVLINVIVVYIVIKQRNDIGILKSKIAITQIDENKAWNAYIKTNELGGFEMKKTFDLGSEENSNYLKPLLVVQGHVCSMCLDGLLLGFEKLKDTISVIQDIKIINTINKEGSNTKSNYFGNFKDKVLFPEDISINYKSINNFPEIFFLLIDENMRIINYLEYDKRYSNEFFKCLISINRKYNLLNSLSKRD